MGKIDKHILQSWIITLLTSPIFFILLIIFEDGLNRTEAKDFFTLYFLFVIIGTFCAVPTLVFLILISHFCKNHVYWNKISISLTTTVFIFLSFILADMNFFSNGNIKFILFPLIYSIIFTVALYKSNNLFNSIQKLKNKR